MWWGGRKCTYYRKFIGGDTVLAQAWKMSRNHWGEVGEGDYFSQKELNWEKAAHYTTSFRQVSCALECKEESWADEAGEWSRETTPTPVYLLKQLAGDSLQEGSDRVTVVFVNTGSGWMDDKHRAWEQLGRYRSWRQWKVQCLINTSSKEKK